MGVHTFPKAEHLCLQRDIDALFDHPDGSATAWPVRAIWKWTADEGQAATPDALPTPPPAQVLMSVAKRRLHHAVDRNRAKRQLREAYRLQKLHLPVHIAFIWMADAPQPSAKVQRSVSQILHRLCQSYHAS